MASGGSLGPGTAPQECGGRVIPPISRVARSSWSCLCSLPPSRAAGWECKSRAGRMADAGTRACCWKWGGALGGQPWPSPRQVPGAATIPPHPKSSCRGRGSGRCGSQEPGGGSLLVLRHTFWWFILCETVNKNSSACACGWFFRAHTRPPAAPRSPSGRGSWLHPPVLASTAWDLDPCRE